MLWAQCTQSTQRIAVNQSHFFRGTTDFRLGMLVLVGKVALMNLNLESLIQITSTIVMISNEWVNPLTKDEIVIWYISDSRCNKYTSLCKLRHNLQMGGYFRSLVDCCTFVLINNCRVFWHAVIMIVLHLYVTNVIFIFQNEVVECTGSSDYLWDILK